MDEGLGQVGLFLRVNECHERISRTVSIPERECGIVDEVALVHLLIGTAVGPAHIAEHGGCRHSVVKSGVEHLFHLRIIGGDIDFSQFLVPCLACGPDGGVEVPSGQFRLEVGLGLIDADGRESHLDEERLIALYAEHGDRVGLLFFHFHIAGEFSGEEHMLALGPSLAVAVAGEHAWTLQLHGAVGHLVPTDALLQVDGEEASLAVGTEGIAVESHAAGCGEFNEYIGIGKFDAVVARCDMLAEV